jgi:hypothetical protein
VQQLWLEPKEGDDLRSNPSLGGPPAPVVQIGLEVEMNESIPQRPRHREMDTSLGGRIPRRDDDPSVRKHILPESAIQYQLIAAGLRHLRRGGQFIQKQDALARGREKFGRHPLGLVGGDPGQASKIDRIKLYRAHVEKVDAEIVGELGNDLLFADTACTPDMQRHTLADQRMKRFIEFRWFHGLSFWAKRFR